MSRATEWFCRIVGVPDSPGVRRWAWVAVVDSLGSGLVLPLVILYFTQVARLTAVQVGLAMSLAGVAGVALIPLSGYLVDRVGAKPVVCGAFLLAAGGILGYLASRDVWLLAGSAALAQTADVSGRPARHALLASIADGEERSRLMAFNRSTRNAGYGIGGLLAAVVLGIGTPRAYGVAIALDALTFLAAAALVVGVPVKRRAPEPVRSVRSGGGFAEVVRDWRYVVIAALHILVLLETNAFVVGMPLWAVQHTRTPHSYIGVLFTINTLMIVFLQVRAARGIEGPQHVRPTYARAAITFCLGVAGYIGAQVGGPYVAMVIITAAVIAHSVAELSASAGEWSVSIGLAPEKLRGRYLAVFALGYSAQSALGPVVVTYLVGDQGSVGWIVLGILVSCGCLVSAELATRHPRTPRSALVAVKA